MILAEMQWTPWHVIILVAVIAIAIIVYDKWPWPPRN